MVKYHNIIKPIILLFCSISKFWDLTIVVTVLCNESVEKHINSLTSSTYRRLFAIRPLSVTLSNNMSDVLWAPAPSSIRHVNRCSARFVNYLRVICSAIFIFCIIYKTILAILLYGYITWSLTLREECRLRVFENRILRRIFGSKRDANV